MSITTEPGRRRLKHPRVVLTTFTVLLLAITVVTLEYAARFFGVQPGIWGDDSFFGLADAELVAGMVADEHGVLKYDPEMRNRIAELISSKASIGEVANVFGIDYEQSVSYIVNSYTTASPELRYDNAFNRMIARIRDDPKRSRLQQAYLDYAARPLNSDGFRSIEFADYGPGVTEVLLLGDSFTFGYDARPLTSSFADELGVSGLAVFNTGIPGVDPVQYIALAQRFIPELEPDVVVVNFYMGNDVMFYEQELEPYRFPLYPTTTGLIMATPMGEHLGSLETVRDYFLEYERIPARDERLFNWFCAQTAIGTRLWGVLASRGWVSRRSTRFEAYEARNTLEPDSPPLSGEQMRRIKAIADQHGTRFVLAVLPDLSRAPRFDLNELFEGLSFHVPELTEGDYEAGLGAHLNNQGHRKYAEFLRRLIEP